MTVTKILSFLVFYAVSRLETKWLKSLVCSIFLLLPLKVARRGGEGGRAHNSQGTWPFSDSPVDYFDNLGIVNKLTLIFCLY